MSFVGTLEDLPLPELLQALATAGKTGRLTLSDRDGHGLVVFREGKIVYAASNSARETLGSLLVCRGLVDEGTLVQALAVQHRLKERRRLGSVLLDMGAVGRETLDEVLGQQTESVLSELLRWRGGFFRFQPEDAAAAPDEVEVDVKDLLLHEGMSAKDAMLEAARLLDEAGRGAGAGAKPAGNPEAPSPKAAASPLAAPWPHTAGMGPAAGVAPGALASREPTALDLAALKAMMAAVQSPSVTAETTLELLRYAVRVVRRAVLFAPRRDAIHGLAQRGLALPDADQPDADQRVRSLRLPWDEPSTLGEVAQRREAFRGPLPRAAGNERLVEALGGWPPAEAVVVPMLVGGKCALLLYGDNLPQLSPIGPTEGLELLMMQTGLALEKKLLEERLERLSSAAGSRGLTAGSRTAAG